MKIIHTGDIHLGEMNGPMVNGDNARMLDTQRCMDNLADEAEQEQPDIILVAGDLFDRSKLWGDQILKEIQIIAIWLRRLASIAPTVVLFGTDNHDNRRAFQTLKAMRIENLFIVDQPELLNIGTADGPIQIVGIPGMHKGEFRALYPGLDMEDENMACSKMLEELIQSFNEQIDCTIPSILLTHYTVVGCELDNGEHIFLKNDVVLPKEVLAASPYDLICLGHIHKAQEVDGCGHPTYYCGPLNGITFNEEGQEKGFWLHYLATREPMFIVTPYRPFKTLNIDFRSIDNITEYIRQDMTGIFSDAALDQFDVAGKIVRVHYQCTEEQRKQISHKAIEDSLKEIGAFYVQEIKPVEVFSELQKQGLSENNSPIDNLVDWLRTEGFSEDNSAVLVDLATPLVDVISSGMSIGKLTGVFKPVSLEVKHYRSYQEEFFSFADISFATVNGPNGVGKSAFFMDAISDCLYEETREGELTGWISNGTKSGTLTFTFSMGESMWRVIRTRTRSGKITLALQESLPEEWADRSGTTSKDTQAKIVDLLGMDAMTFRSCALIMQDAYGIFLEAELSDRMEVLGNILGLGIYDQLKELAKLKYSAINKELESKKMKIEILDEKLKAKPFIQTQLDEADKELATVKLETADLESKLLKIHESLKELEIRRAHHDELVKQRVLLNNEINQDNQQITQYQNQITAAQKILDVEPTIFQKCSELETTRTKIIQLKAKLPRLQDIDTEISRVTSEHNALSRELLAVNGDIKNLEKALAQKTELEGSVQQYRKSVDDLKVLDELETRHSELNSSIQQIEKQLAISKELLYQKTVELQNCQKKVLILSNAGCIDPDKAKCKFLIDAQQSKNKIEELNREIRGINLKRQPDLDKLNNLSSQLEKLGYDSAKHSNIKTLVVELRAKTFKAAELSGKAQLLQNHSQQQISLNTRITALQVRKDQLQKEKQICELEISPLKALEEALPKLEHWATGKEKLPAARETIKNCGESINKLNDRVNHNSITVSQITVEIEKIVREIAGVAELSLQAEETNSRIKTCHEDCNRLHGVIGGLNNQLEGLAADEQERTQLTAEIEPGAILVTNYQVLIRAFDTDGIPFSIVRQVVPELSNMANEILAQMTGGKMSLEMKTERIQKSNKKEVNALEIWITDYIRGSLPYKSRSGGQKVKAALSVGFALADLKARRAGIQLGMMFVDEPPFLDADGADAYCDALELLSQRYQNMIVLAISHDLRMKARFPQQIEVEDTGETGSKIRMLVA